MWDFDPFTADEEPHYAEDCATYTTTLAELASAAEREHEALRGMRGADRKESPLTFDVDHEFIAVIHVPVDVVRDLAAKHTHPGARDEQITVDSGGLVVMECGERFIVTKGDDRVFSQEEWEALTAKRSS
ncbi:hypothetical protein WKI65_38205 [Streptomyces sp. MS1.AVA.3]|uniref:hypothetical protein n=1 Tax=Streptomyces decoyicus TaxID=249567 RepID=UPI0030C056B0